MPPLLATCFCSCGVLGLFWLDREHLKKTSPGLWLAVTWFFLCSSRSVAQWLGEAPIANAAMEGSPLDRVVDFCMIAVGVLIVVQRKRLNQIIRANGFVILVFLYCALSTLWSDYPDIAFKRWIKSVGDLIMILIVLSDRNRIEAIKGLFTRTGFLLIPFSILLIKYYPDLGRGYDRWSGAAAYNGVALSKNDLGAICLVFGLSALWRLLMEFDTGNRAGRPLRLTSHLVILIMTAWLFSIVNSMTSLWCFLIGVTVLLALRFRMFKRRPMAIHVLLAALILIPFAMLFLHIGMNIAHNATGRDVETLTTRTLVWAAALKLAGNSILGTGFQSFWLGPRLQAMWNIFWWQPNEVHNGYLAVFLDLGWIGVAMLGALIVSGYRSVVDSVRRNAPEGNLMMAYFAVALVYNFTETAFFQMMTLVWIIFLFVLMDTRCGERACARPRIRRSELVRSEDEVLSVGGD